MKQNKVETMLKILETNIKNIHPENPLAFEMAKRYRELQNDLNEN